MLFRFLVFLFCIWLSWVSKTTFKSSTSHSRSFCYLSARIHSAYDITAYLLRSDVHDWELLYPLSSWREVLQFDEDDIAQFPRKFLQVKVHCSRFSWINGKINSIIKSVEREDQKVISAFQWIFWPTASLPVQIVSSFTTCWVGLFCRGQSGGASYIDL